MDPKDPHRDGSKPLSRVAASRRERRRRFSKSAHRAPTPKWTSAVAIGEVTQGEFLETLAAGRNKDPFVSYWT